MPADRFHPPDLVLVVECDTVRFIRAVLFQKRRKPQYAFARCADIRQHEHDDILLADAARHILFLFRLCLLIPHQRVRREHARVTGDRLRRGHADVRFVYAGRRPHAVLRIDARTRGIAHRVCGKLDREMSDHGRIGSLLLPRLNGDELLDVEASVVGTGDHCGVVVAGFFADQNCGAGHMRILFSFVLFFLNIRKFRFFVNAHVTGRRFGEIYHLFGRRGY